MKATEQRSRDRPISVTAIPPGYRDWKFISVAHEEGNLNSFAAILGNDVAIKAYREGKLPFPDGAMIAALHWRFVWLVELRSFTRIVLLLQVETLIVRSMLRHLRNDLESMRVL